MEFTYSIASKEYVLYIPTFFHIGSYFEIRGHNVRIQISIKGLIFASYSMLPKFIIIKFFLQRVRPVYSNSSKARLKELSFSYFGSIITFPTLKGIDC